MALETTDNLRQGIKLGEVNPTLIAKFDGIDTIFGNIAIQKYVRIGDPGLEIGNDWTIGGFNLVDNQSPYITYNTGETTSKITQKLDPSRGLGSSVSQMAITMIDKNGEITELISPGFVVDDILGRFTTIYLGLRDSAWPEDYNIIFQGVVENVSSGPNEITFYLNNTEEKKRAEIIEPVETSLTAPINYRSVVIQDLLYKNAPNVTNNISVSYVGGGTKGSEVVTNPTPTSIQVQIESGVSLASDIKKAVENSPNANQLVEVETLDDDDPQVTQGATLLGIDTSLTVANAANLLEPVDILTPLVLVNDELIAYTAKSSNTLTGLIRGYQNTTPELHENEDNVAQAIRLSGNGIEMALKLMLSGGPEFYLENAIVKSFQYFDTLTSIDSAVFFQGINLEKDFGVSIGDTITITGASNPANNLTSIIADIGFVNDSGYAILNDPLTDEIGSGAVAKFKSPWNTLPIGLSMLPREVDVKQHLFVRDTFLPIFNLDITVGEIPNGKTFLEKEIYLPMGCYSVPRKGRSSVVVHVGPLAFYDVKVFDRTTVRNPENLKVRRGINENFFNKVTIKYDYDYLDDKPDSIYKEESKKSSLIPVGSKPFTIEARSIRTSSGGSENVEISARRYLARYERGAEFIKGIEVDFKTGYEIEIGDIVAVDYADLKLSDAASGTRLGEIKKMEVLNKTLNNKTAQVSIDVVNTVFDNNDRFGLISPATIVDSGANTTTKVFVKKSYGTKSFERESNKWRDHIGQNVRIRSEDFTTIYDTKIIGFDNNTPQSFLIQAVPTAPSEGWIIELINYPDNPDKSFEAHWKLRYAFFSPQVQAVNSVTLGQDSFEVAPGDTEKFWIGAPTLIHNYSYSQVSQEALVTAIDKVNNIITIDTNAGFNINDTHFIDLIGFHYDESPPYRII